MSLYCGIDLHSTNNFISVLNESDKPLFEKRMPNDLERVLLALAPYQDEPLIMDTQPLTTLIMETFDYGHPTIDNPDYGHPPIDNPASHAKIENIRKTLHIKD